MGLRKSALLAAIQIAQRCRASQQHRRTWCRQCTLPGCCQSMPSLHTVTPQRRTRPHRLLYTRRCELASLVAEGVPVALAPNSPPLLQDEPATPN